MENIEEVEVFEEGIEVEPVEREADFAIPSEDEELVEIEEEEE
jgi:hypothetical protein